MPTTLRLAPVFSWYAWVPPFEPVFDPYPAHWNGVCICIGRECKQPMSPHHCSTGTNPIGQNGRRGESSCCGEAPRPPKDPEARVRPDVHSWAERPFSRLPEPGLAWRRSPCQIWGGCSIMLSIGLMPPVFSLCCQCGGCSGPA